MYIYAKQRKNGTVETTSPRTTANEKESVHQPCDCSVYQNVQLCCDDSKFTGIAVSFGTAYTRIELPLHVFLYLRWLFSRTLLFVEGE